MQTIETFGKLNWLCEQMQLNRFSFSVFCRVCATYDRPSSVFTVVLHACACGVIVASIATNWFCINICAAGLPCWAPRREKKKNQPVTSWKAISVRKLSRVRSGLMVLWSWGRETVSCEAGFPSAHGCHGSILPPSFCAFFFFYQFSSLQDWNAHMVHYSLETIRDSLRMNEEDLLNHLLRRWSVTDQTFIQFYGWEWKTVISQKKPVWTGRFVFTFVAFGKIKGVVSFDCGFGGYLIFPVNQKFLDLLRLFFSLAVKGVHSIFLPLPLWSFSTGVDSFFNYLLFVCIIVCSCWCWSVTNHPYWCTNTTIPHELQLAFCFFCTVYFPLTSQ